MMGKLRSKNSLFRLNQVKTIFDRFFFFFFENKGVQEGSSETHWPLSSTMLGSLPQEAELNQSSSTLHTSFTSTHDPKDRTFVLTQEDLEEEDDENEGWVNDSENAGPGATYMLVETEQLLQLMKFCPSCGSPVIDVTWSRQKRGAASTAHIVCSNDSCASTTWRTSSMQRNAAKVNFDIGVASLMTGMGKIWLSFSLLYKIDLQLPMSKFKNLLNQIVTVNVFS
jgi:hypothetical protein